MTPSAPTHEIVSAVDEVLRGLPEHRRTSFRLRLERWWDDLATPLVELYGAEPAAALVADLVVLAAAAYRDRDDSLHLLDERRLLEPDWLQSPRMLGYAAYVDRFAGTIAGVEDHLPYLGDLGVTYLHLMPLLLPRAGDNDGGYAVQDYGTVRPDLGSMEDLRHLATSLRDKGISLVLDLVVNHVAREHEWALRARAGDTTYRDYFLVYPDRTEPDAWERTLPEVFPDFAPGSFTWDDDLDGWVWTTFNSWQWDVNWANPAVFREYAGIVLDLANVGVEVLRIDAIAFLWKRPGTSCQNQPEVHSIAQALRSLARIVCPATAFKAEAIVAPTDLVPYLGTGKHSGKVSDLAYHNSLMVQIWSMLATGDARLATRGARRPACGSEDLYVDHLCALPRRHRLGHRRRRRGDGGPQRLAAPTLPRRLVCRGVAGVDRPRPGLPGEPPDRRPADQRDGRRAGRARRRNHLGRPPGGRPRRLTDPVGAQRGRRVRRHTGGVERGRARDAERPPVGRGGGTRWGQPVGPPATAGLGPGRASSRPLDPGGPRLRGHRAPRPGAGVPATAARLGVERRHRAP